MATSCEDISAQMMELLYGELPADARASVDAHVAGCARCRSELEGFEKTRALARRGLDEAPPARARAAIMQAAAAHLAAQAQAQPAQAQAAQVQAPVRPPARKAAVPDKVSFWDRLRVRWAFPTLATVGAVAVFVIANRVFLNPERTFEKAVETEAAPAAQPKVAVQSGPLDSKLPIAPAAPPALAPRLERRRPETINDFEEAAPAEDAKPAARRGAGADLYKDSAMGGEKHAAKGGRKREQPEKAFAEPAPAAAAKPADKARLDDALEGKFAPPPPPREERTIVKRKAPVALAKDDDAPAAPATARPGGGKNKTIDGLTGNEAERAAPVGNAGGFVGGGAAQRGPSAGFGSGTAQAAPVAAAPRPAPAREQAPKQVAATPAPVASVSSSAAPAPAAAPAPTIAKARAKKSSAESADEGYAAAEADAKEEKKQQSNARNNTNDVLLQRAERLFAEGRWGEAATIYRELLRRDPHNDDADRWRRRLVAAEAAEVNERNANLGEKRNAEAQERVRKAAPAKPAQRSGKAAASDAAQ